MKYMEKLEELVKKRHGTVLSTDLDQQGIPRTYLQQMVKMGKLEKVDHGTYVAVDAIEDEMYTIQTKYSKIIFSHETALFLHGLSDRTPFEYAVTVPSGYKAVSRLKESCKIYYIRRELHDLGCTTMVSAFGNPIRVYDVERTICDIVRSRNRMDVQIFLQAIKEYFSSESNARKIIKYGKQFGIEEKIRTYMEVLS
ncbi:type IV toxin-antitoxin system AbiEi family antitoxin domain-containing protein [Alkalibacter rhizosphaerae]|uniref:Type IV toxin-antitoxin system AbiEi family antitoxin domain-containing protein n=1 Tax=Alkalibacter rhizosphaerae TaxID=2815577 RepID=A0A974XDJ9_9FIRM|nr:type IV toxin-antitoxin system AbiEi family antitoxin domain-containing protein [Alkalibacter rhizosphaerae]QSX07686.1 type IV toxin-antitoxin system AbiEi family antitoxin domain-containing protein [Alkalibacter rhizosphaerae]